MPIQTQFIQANGLTFEVDRCGTGERLALCLHGFPESSYSWRYQLPFLADLGYTAWAPNLRGYANSSRPRTLADYAAENLLADVAGLIDAAGKKSTLLIGHDWGGALGWLFVLRKIRPVEGFVALNIPHPKLFLERMKRWPQIARSWYIFFFQIPWLPEFLFGLRHAKAIGDAIRNSAVDKNRFPDEVLAVYRRNASQPGALTAMINWYRAFFRHRFTPAQRRALNTPIDIPTLMIWGEQDAALGKELTYGTEKLVKDFTIRYLPDVSHWVQQEAPNAVNQIMAEWLSRHS